MDLSQSDEKTLQILREFIKDHVLPRLTQLEEEVRYLRHVTWPVCQMIRENSQIDNIDYKKQFLKLLDIEEARELIIEKSRISGGPVKGSTHHLLGEEMARVISYYPANAHKKPFDQSGARQI